MSVIELFLYLMIYSCLGWFCESMYISIGRKEWVNSGFLYGPFCPIYGFGAIFVLYLLKPFVEYPILVFVFGGLITSMLEYFTSWLLEKMFHILWWDYSNQKWNIKGRVCLLNSTLFGIMSLFVIYGIHPMISSVVESLSNNFKYLLFSLLFIFLTIDLVLSVKSLVSFKQSITQFENKLEKIKNKLTEQIPDLHFDMNQKVEEFFEQANFEDIKHHLQLHYEALSKTRQHIRLKRNFPELKLTNKKNLQSLSEYIKRQYEKTREH